jgi:hypothetical protein
MRPVLQGSPCHLRLRFDDLDAIHFTAQFPRDCRLIARAGSDFYPVNKRILREIVE